MRIFKYTAIFRRRSHRHHTLADRVAAKTVVGDGDGNPFAVGDGRSVAVVEGTLVREGRTALHPFLPVMFLVNEEYDQILQYLDGALLTAPHSNIPIFCYSNPPLSLSWDSNPRPAHYE